MIGGLGGRQILSGFDHNKIKVAFQGFGGYIKIYWWRKGVQEEEVNIGVSLWRYRVYERGIRKYLVLYGCQFMSTTMHGFYVHVVCGCIKEYYTPLFDF